MNVSPRSAFVLIGVGSSNLQLSVKAINGFNQAVTVSVTGLPAGVSTTPNSPFAVKVGAQPDNRIQRVEWCAPGL